jgi:chromate transporter
MKPSSKPTFREAVRFWLKLGFISFGGPAGQIAIMHRELVEQRGWIGEKRFLHALNFCMLLPGPEATQLATYCGWLLHGLRGALAAGVLFVLPGAALLWLLSWIYAAYGVVPAVAAIFHGLKPVVLAIVLAALLRIGRRTLTNRVAWVFASGAFLALFVFRIPFPAVVFAALGIGFILGAKWPAYFDSKEGEGDKAGPEGSDHSVPPAHTIRTTAIGVAAWLSPVVVAGIALGWGSTLVQVGWFFSKAAVVTFGGAYAVLPYVAQQAVENHGWLTAGQMLDGLGLAETTPGPLIIVLQYVGYLAGWQQSGGISPMLAATLGAGMATWTTFVPSYLFVLVGAPYVERLRRNPGLSAALATVTASVVGVILNLAAWFAEQTLMPGESLDVFAVAVAAIGFIGLHFARLNVIAVIVAGGLAGLVAGWF